MEDEMKKAHRNPHHKMEDDIGIKARENLPQEMEEDIKIKARENLNITTITTKRGHQESMTLTVTFMTAITIR